MSISSTHEPVPPVYAPLVPFPSSSPTRHCPTILKSHFVELTAGTLSLSLSLPRSLASKRVTLST